MNHGTEPFGECPECGNSDGYRNIYKQHFFYCDEHQKAWLVGLNMFSSWRDEREEEWVSNYKHLENYELVGEDAAGETLGGAMPLETLIPPR